MKNILIRLADILLLVAGPAMLVRGIFNFHQSVFNLETGIPYYFYSKGSLNTISAGAALVALGFVLGDWRKNPSDTLTH